MDNRRMPLPRVSHPQVYTLRSSNYPADENVLPNKQEQKKYRIIVQPTLIEHRDMDNDATTEQRKIINSYIEKYLSN